MEWYYAGNQFHESKFSTFHDEIKNDQLRLGWKAERVPDLWEKVKRSQQEVKQVTRNQVLRAFYMLGLGSILRFCRDLKGTGGTTRGTKSL